MSRSLDREVVPRERHGVAEEVINELDGVPRYSTSTVSTPESLPDGRSTTHAQDHDRPTAAVQQVRLQSNYEALDNIEQHSQSSATVSRSQSFPYSLLKAQTMSSRRGLDLSLPRFDELSGLKTQATHAMTDSRRDVRVAHDCGLNNISVKPGSTQHLLRSSSLGPLTPPHEPEVLSWHSTRPPQGIHTSTASDAPPSAPANIALTPAAQSNAGQQEVSDGRSSDASTLEFANSPWFLRAVRAASQSLEQHNLVTSSKVISQVLPANAADQRSSKTYEMICDHLQRVLPEPQYISITHALTVSPGQVVEDFPKSPPATPNFRGGDSYFGDQSVFTHAAQVPIHHELRAHESNLVAPPQRHIMFSEAHLAILERFIPPSTKDETVDFFNAFSHRSYLADRLPELAADVGSLLLIYPTRKGGQIFAKRYVGPVLDPLLRETSILKGLNTNAAERLGTLKGVASLCEFEEMRSRIRKFCTSMNTSSPIQRSRTEFALVHDEAVRVILDRNTWMTWFVEQEQARMKQDLMEYHREGGKLPKGEENNTELTAGMLTREITEGFRKSTTEAGNIGIEVGVFVIRRHRKISGT